MSARRTRPAWTISAWVKPAALGGTVFSQKGSSYSTFTVSTTTSDTWQVAVNTTGSTYATQIGASVRTGLWTHLTLTYDGTTGTYGDGLFRLYANGTQIADLAQAPLTTAGPFMVGASQSAGSPSNFFNGQVADIQVWDTLTAPAESQTPGSGLIPVTPVRILDSRAGSGIGTITGPLSSGATYSVPIVGAKISSTATVPAGITAVALSVTVADQSQSGYVTLYADGEPRPGTSTLDFPASDPLSNNVIVPVGPDGKIAIYNYGTATDQVLLDLTGYFITPAAATADQLTTPLSTYTPLADPQRLFYTGSGLDVAKATVASNAKLVVPVVNNTSGINVPSGITAVAINIEALASSGDNGWLAAYPDTTSNATPVESTVSFVGGTAYATTAIIPVPTDGDIDIYNGSGQAVNIVGDLSGYFTNSCSPTNPCQYYHPLSAARIVDTRLSDNPLPASGSPENVPDPVVIVAPQNPTLVLNITVVTPADAGHLSAWPGSQTSTGTSILNFPASQDMATLGLMYTANNNTFNIANSTSTTVNYLLDINGYFQ